MKQPFINPIFKLSHITIVLCVLLMVGCSKSLVVTALEVSNPVSMSPRVGVNPNQDYQSVRKFREILSRGDSPYFLQSKIRKAFKGSEKMAIKEIEIDIHIGYALLIFTAGTSASVRVKGVVVEAQ